MSQSVLIRDFEFCRWFIYLHFGHLSSFSKIFAIFRLPTIRSQQSVCCQFHHNKPHSTWPSSSHQRLFGSSPYQVVHLVAPKPPFNTLSMFRPSILVIVCSFLRSSSMIYEFEFKFRLPITASHRAPNLSTLPPRCSISFQLISRWANPVYLRNFI